MVKKSEPNTQNAERSSMDVPEKPGRKSSKKNIREKADELTVRIEKFKRGPQAPVRHIKDKKLRGQLRASELLVSDAVLSAAKAEQWLLPAEAGTLEAEGMERTYRFQQVEILKEIETVSAQKAFDLSLPTLGPYHLKYTRSGRHALLGGRQGHLAIMEWGRAHLVTELQVKETTRDIAFLHNETFFAAAQKKHVYIYDKRGLEVHCLRDHNEVHAMQFLPYHFLLATIGKPGVLVYQDTSTGQMVAEHKTKLGRCDVLQQNPWNAVLCAGHHNGVVTMWSPNSSGPLVQMLCHQGPIKAIAVDMEGYHMVTAGQDKQVKVWDVRTYKPIHNYFSAAPAVSLDISQRRLLAVGYSGHVQVWKDALNQKATAPYMNHHLPPGAKVENVTFCPYDDVLGVGHSKVHSRCHPRSAL
ncbi:hypothetical protein CYMTET_52883 [Cymbomonas tetramitiformis]|uniref:BING4 C-terminal domain-containing protein n=1 Tax=Cymbomonas tetramitiformis TaxID=36881 RepID=A0AAE0BJX9_9CHLO|nr:hypothetical protein CYMTET_52883 [Cymbomonas tetramitiformis]